MKDCKNFRIEAWKEFLALFADIADDDGGLRRISFYFLRKEFEAFVSGERDSFQDISHHLHTFGECCTFYDMEIPMDARGIMKVPYYRMNIPFFMRNLMLRIAKRIWAADPDERIEVRFSPERLARIERLYGIGKGQSKLDMQPETEAFFGECMEKGGNFKDMIDRLLVIAQNTTTSFYQTGRVELSKDWDGFLFQIITPKGNRSMHGGVINHGRDGKVDWSIHT